MSNNNGEIQFELFEHFLKAQSKEFLHKTIVDAFAHRTSVKLPQELLSSVATALEIEQNVAEQLLNELTKLIGKILFEGRTNELSQIHEIFATSGLAENLKNLLSKLLLDKCAKFRQTLLNEENMMPKFVDLNWRVDIKMMNSNSEATSATAVNQAQQQTCILQIKIQEPPAFVGQTPQIENLNLELSKQTLDTMCDGLNKIKNQLNSIASA
jgi:hypothetical protein